MVSLEEGSKSNPYQLPEQRGIKTVVPDKKPKKLYKIASKKQKREPLPFSNISTKFDQNKNKDDSSQSSGERNAVVSEEYCKANDKVKILEPAKKNQKKILEQGHMPQIEEVPSQSTASPPYKKFAEITNTVVEFKADESVTKSRAIPFSDRGSSVLMCNEVLSPSKTQTIGVVLDQQTPEQEKAPNLFRQA